MNFSINTNIYLFSILQESLMNNLLHVQVIHVMILIEEAGDQIQLTVHEDGKGFEIDKQTRKSGLTRMRERAASINGQLTIQSDLGKGTRVLVSVAKQ